MKASQNNFFDFIKGVKTGTNAGPIESVGLGGTNGVGTGTYTGVSAEDGGILVDIPVPLNGNLLTSGTTLVLSSAQLVLSTAAGASPGILNMQFSIPRDYDEASDTMMIRFAAHVNTADVGVPITVTGTPTITPIATGTPTTGAAVNAGVPFSLTPATASNLTATEAVYELRFNGNGLKRDDTITVALAYSGTTSAAALLYWLEWHYASTIVSYNETDAATEGSYAQPPFPSTSEYQNSFFGRPLR